VLGIAKEPFLLWDFVCDLSISELVSSPASSSIKNWDPSIDGSRILLELETRSLSPPKSKPLEFRFIVAVLACVQQALPAFSEKNNKGEYLWSVLTERVLWPFLNIFTPRF